MVVAPMDFVHTLEERPRSAHPQDSRPRARASIDEPNYTQAEHLERLRERGLGTKRSLAMREFIRG